MDYKLLKDIFGKKVRYRSERRDLANDLVDNQGSIISQAYQIVIMDRKVYRYQEKR